MPQALATRPKLTKLTTTSAVIDAFGGNPGLAEFLTRPNKSVDSGAVSNWRKGVIPSRFYCVMIDALRAKGFDAPRTLWGQLT